MRLLPLLCLFIALCVGGCDLPLLVAPADDDPDLARDTLVETEPLVRAVNRYREAHGLQPVRFSSALTSVAVRHVIDLETNRPDTGPCNLHSWSKHGAWTPCCYTYDDPPATCMWNKPAEITHGGYPGLGFETAYREVGGTATVARAVAGWRDSPAHNEAILNQGPWANIQWNAMGAAMSAHYAVVWFGRETDLAEP